MKEVIWIAGGNGLVGNHLIDTLNTEKYEICILSRNASNNDKGKVRFIEWSTDKHTIGQAPKPDHIINLAGAGIVDERWTSKRKELIISSRVNSAITIQKYLDSKKVRPKTYISASAVGYYGDRGSELLTEDSKAGNEFLSESCIQWENAANHTGNLCDRTVILRIGIVLSLVGGALPKLLMTKNIGVFNYFGDGDQYYPWIHIDDLARIFTAVLESKNFNGIYNAVAPQEITNKEMIQEIIKTNHMKGMLIPAPTFALKMAMGEMSAVILNSNRVASDKIQNDGFVFTYKRVGPAVQNLLAERI